MLDLQHWLDFGYSDKARARHESRSPVVLLLEQLSREDSLTQDVFSLRINKYHLGYGFDPSST